MVQNVNNFTHVNNFTLIEQLIVVQLANYINGNAKKIPLPCPVIIDDTETTGEQLTLRPMTGGKILRQYVGGSYVGNFPFGVQYQMASSEIAGRFALLDIPLWALSDFFESKQNQFAFDTVCVTKIEMTGIPYALKRDMDGTCVNQAIFILNYKRNNS
ncbi:MAG: hypothetical protein FWF15_05130 [Oscillospiraceae bacterium]|nr:hypothetical protein [Oscillospiraceae bacterium]